MPSEKSQPLMPPEPGPQGGEKLSDPDLNPLTNPTLARNLGKWAQVYFTTPREHREHAVGELLRELENLGQFTSSPAASKTSDGLEAKAGEAATGATPSNSPANAPGRGDDLQCPRCRRMNAAPHCFCGYCGSPLRETDPAFPGPVVQLKGQRDDRGALLVPRSPSSRMSDAQVTDLEWLRERSLTSLQPDHRVSHSFRIVLVFLVFTGLAAFIYFRRRDSSPAWSESKPVIQASSAAAPHSASAMTELNSPALKAAAIDTGARLPFEKNQPPEIGEVQQSGAQGKSSSPVLPGALEIRGQSGELSFGDSGDRELAIAETFLQSDAKARDPSEAAKWLWKSVSKHNATALVLLADLYERGDGVSKSCEQAQVLLTAGAKRGSADAAQKLRNLQSSGCK